MEEKQVDFSELEQDLPAVVYRNWHRWRDNIPYSPRTLANMDSLGTGPKERIMCGRVVGYPRASLVAWLRERSKIIS